MVVIPVHGRRKRRHKWIIIPLILLVLGIATGRQFIFRKDPPAKDALSRIRERGYLVALTDKNSLDYFINKGHPMGYQLELLKSFADYLNIPLKIVVSNDASKLFYFLDLNAGDLLALNLPVTREGKRELHFSNPFGETRMVLIQRKSGGKNDSARLIRHLSDFKSDTVYLRINLLADPLLRQFHNKTGKKVILKKVSGSTTLDLVRLVAEKKINYAVCEENLAMVAKRFYRNIDAEMVVSKFYLYGWGVNLASDSLLVLINDWLSEMKKRDLRKIYLEYYDNPKVMTYLRSEYCSLNGNKLSPYDEAIRSHSKLIRWDWRLVASLIYEESNFREGQVSARNARGLMQLMPETAKKFGMDSLSGPSQQILAGVRYIAFLDRQLPDEITDMRERINFVLASYNVGIGKVLSARSKARQYGRNPNVWNDNVDYYLTRRSKRDPNPQPDTLTGLLPYESSGGFVDNILERYHHYKNIIPL